MKFKKIEKKFVILGIAKYGLFVVAFVVNMINMAGKKSHFVLV